jgi:CBS domain-containing protein
MFAIYGTSGRLFHGPFEELRQVSPVLRGLRLRPVEAEQERAEPAPPWPAPTRPPVSPHPHSSQAQHALQAYAQDPNATRQPLRRVAEVMTREAVVVTEDTTLWEAFERLARDGLGQAPVVDAQDRLVGLLAWDHLLRSGALPGPRASLTAWPDLMRQRVSQWMLTPVPSVEPDTDIRRLALVLWQTGLSGLPVVVADGLVSGFVSRSDILRALTNDPPLDLWAR